MPRRSFFQPKLGNIVIVVDCESNAMPVPPITVGSAKLKDFPIREAVISYKITNEGYIKLDPMQKVNYLIPCTFRTRKES